MRFELTILGSNSAIPAHGRHPTAQILNYNEKYYLLDCGEGTQIRLNDLKVRKSKIGHIFISHLHGDHYFGLIGLLTTLNLLGHQKPVTVYGPPRLQEILELQMEVSGLRMKFPLHFHHLRFDKPEKLLDTDELTVSSVPVNHRIPCAGFIFKEKPQQKTYLPEKGKVYDIPVHQIDAIKRGADYTTPTGKVIPNEELTAHAPRPRKYAYITDTTAMPSIISSIQNADLLYHEATFVAALEERAKDTFHTTSKQAAELAKKAKVQKLLIGHFSAKYKDLSQMLEEAKAVFPNTELAEEGGRFVVGE